MTLHPDKGEDPEVFTKIAKAYEDLTQEEARENLEKYGNPDGPRAASFGIARPSWIIDKNNSFWSSWWYKSVKYGSTNILIQTSKLYSHLLSRAKTMPVLRVLMILATAVEFSPSNQDGLSYADMMKRVDPLRKELKDLETKAEDTRQKGEEITKIIAELEASIAKYKEEYAMVISDASVIKNDLSTVEKKVKYFNN
uniref:J domain-containing protein n=1 Tax=Amphimedon queenslandica TaxID=400682 RepID=A0A1X7TAP1_AMPQE